MPVFNEPKARQSAVARLGRFVGCICVVVLLKQCCNSRSRQLRIHADVQGHTAVDVPPCGATREKRAALADLVLQRGHHLLGEAPHAMDRRFVCFGPHRLHGHPLNMPAHQRQGGQRRVTTSQRVGSGRDRRRKVR